MSYLTYGTAAVVIGIPGIAFGGVGILAIIVGLSCLYFGLRDMAPGTAPGLCHKLAHDWRRQLPGMPAGATCRNCLVRKDGAFIGWMHSPKGVPHLQDPMLGVFIPQNAPEQAKKKPPQALFLVDDPRMPRVALIPGQPIVWPALRAIPLRVEIAEGSSPLPPR